MMTTFCSCPTAGRELADERLLEAACGVDTSSRTARPVPSLASFNRRDRRRLSRSPHSRSTSMPIFSSKERALPGAVARISRRTLAIVCSLISLRFWIVSSVITCFLLVEVRGAVHVVVHDGTSRCVGRRDRGVFDATFEDRVDVLAGRSARTRGGEGACPRRGCTWGPCFSAARTSPNT